jgi:hypothetical protein
VNITGVPNMPFSIIERTEFPQALNLEQSIQCFRNLKFEISKYNTSLQKYKKTAQTALN